MKNRVLHFIRKKSQLKASFIKNQISHHINYEPVIVFRSDKNKEHGGGFANIDADQFKCLNLAVNESLFEKLIFKVCRRISSWQAERIEAFVKTYDVKILHFHYGSDAGIYIPFLKKTQLPSVVSFYG